MTWTTFVYMDISKIDIQKYVEFIFDEQGPSWS